MARLISAKNFQNIMVFWKNNRQKPKGSYLARMLAPPNLSAEGESRAQTDEYRLVFEERSTLLYVSMNGEQLALPCPALKPGDVGTAAKQLSTLAYGNSKQANSIAERLKVALSEGGGWDVVIRPHDRGVYLEENVADGD